MARPISQGLCGDSLDRNMGSEKHPHRELRLWETSSDVLYYFPVPFPTEAILKKWSLLPRDREIPLQPAGKVRDPPGHLLDALGSVVLIMDIASDILQVVHVCPDQHVPQLHKVAVRLIFHCKAKPGEHLDVTPHQPHPGSPSSAPKIKFPQGPLPHPSPLPPGPSTGLDGALRSSTLRPGCRGHCIPRTFSG